MFATIERLESRVLLAASVKLKHGTLIINGDASNDAILLQGTGNQGEVVVSHDSDGDGVVDAVIDTYSGVKNIKINSKAGDDVVALLDLQITGRLSIKTGSGDDCVLLLPRFGASMIGGSVSVNLGEGNDLLYTAGASIGGNLGVKTGGGDDGLVMGVLNVDGALNVKLGGGDDFMGVIDNVFGGGSKANGGGGDDVLVNRNLPVDPGFARSKFESEVDDFSPDIIEDFTVRYSACISRLNLS